MNPPEKLLLLFLIFLAACQQPNHAPVATGESTVNSSVDNGLYLILQEYEDSTAAQAGGVVIPFNHDFLDSNLAGQPEWLEIDTSEIVRLDLALTPEGVLQEDRRTKLVLTLTDSASKRLADFTEQHLRKKVAIVIGGQAVTKHKVKSKIDGGKLQITRCTDNACKYLLLELKRSVKQ